MSPTSDLSSMLKKKEEENPMPKKLRSLLSLLLVAVLAFTPVTAFAADSNEAVLEAVYQSNLRLSSYGEGKYDVGIFAVKNSSDEYSQINAKAKEITSGCTTDREKAFAINKWVAENIYFDYDNFLHSKPRPSCDAVDVFNSQVTVCEGYAALMNAMCHAVGVPCRQILGQIVTSSSYFMPNETAPLLNEGGHAWVEIYVDGQWYMCDPTWDSRNKYEYGEKEYNPSVDDYFCTDIKTFSKTHYTIDYYDRVIIDSFSINPSIYGIKLCGYNASASEVVIPEELGITAIHMRSFYANTKLKKITVASTVETIGDNAFMNCTNLESVVLNEGLREISTLAFSGCSNLKEISLPSTLTSIGYGAFENCKSLNIVKLGSGLKKIGVLAFSGCNSLGTVYYDGTNVEWAAMTISAGNDALLKAKLVTNDSASEEPTITPSGCDHICHKSGLSAIIYKVLLIFWKLFGINQYCSCGAAHY